MPETTQPAPALTARETVTSWLAGFGDALTARDPAAAAALFTPDCFWRDLVAFTWNITTMEGRGEIADMLAATLENVVPTGWQIIAGEEPAEADGIIEAWIGFETAVGRGLGQLRLRDGQCWTLLTTLEELKGHEEARGPRRPKGVAHGAFPGRTSWREERDREQAALGADEQPYVVIVGGGQGGIGLGARLRQLGVPTIIVDRHPRPGDQWRRR